MRGSPFFRNKTTLQVDGYGAEELLTNLQPGATLLASKAYDRNARRD